MNAEERREQLLDAGMRAFSRGGFAGTSTDQVAREAGVSQPYVVRTFGTKKALFLQVFERACGRVRTAFDAVMAEGFDHEDDEDWGRLGLAYTELLADRDLLSVMMHGFAAGDDEEIAAQGRAGMGSIFEAITSTGCDPERAQQFVAHGMLLNVMMSMRAHEHLDEPNGLAPLTECAFGEALEVLA